MRKATLIFLGIFTLGLSIQGQDLKKLNVFVTDFFDTRASITVAALERDPIIATDALKTLW